MDCSILKEMIVTIKKVLTSFLICGIVCRDELPKTVGTILGVSLAPTEESHGITYYDSITIMTFHSVFSDTEFFIFCAVINNTNKEAQIRWQR